jgi:hypothetical protein
MNRRRMMMLQQNKGFELVYDASIGVLPTEWEGYIITGGGWWEMGDGYLCLKTQAYNHRFGVMPKERTIGQSNNISISTVAKIGQNQYPNIVLCVNNGSRAAHVKIESNNATNNSWNIKANNVKVKTHNFDFWNAYAKFELILTTDTYILLINDEEVYTASALEPAAINTAYRYNMIANDAGTSSQVWIKELSYKEW